MLIEDRTNKDRQARYRFRRRHTKEILINIKNLDCIASDREYRMKVRALVDEALDESTSPIDNQPRRKPGRKPKEAVEETASQPARKTAAVKKTRNPKNSG